ncbi:hypothetical protein CIB84_009240, partial [Bambusicola thoracicus]
SLSPTCPHIPLAPREGCPQLCPCPGLRSVGSPCWQHTKRGEQRPMMSPERECEEQRSRGATGDLLHSDLISFGSSLALGTRLTLQGGGGRYHQTHVLQFGMPTRPPSSLQLAVITSSLFKELRFWLHRCPAPFSWTRTFTPLSPGGPRSPGKPIRLPSIVSACGHSMVRAGIQGTPERSPSGTILPKPPCQGTRHEHPSLEASAGTSWGQSPAASTTYLGPWGAWGAWQAISALVRRKTDGASPECSVHGAYVLWRAEGQRGLHSHYSLPAHPGRPSHPGHPAERRWGGLMELSPSLEAMSPCPQPCTHLLTRPASLPQLASPARHPWDARLSWLPRLPWWSLQAPLAHSPAWGALGTRGTLVPFVTFGSSLTREA